MTVAANCSVLGELSGRDCFVLDSDQQEAVSEAVQAL